MDINRNLGVWSLVLLSLKKPNIYSNQIFTVTDLSTKQELINISLFQCILLAQIPCSTKYNHELRFPFDVACIFPNVAHTDIADCVKKSLFFRPKNKHLSSSLQ